MTGRKTEFHHGDFKDDDPERPAYFSPRRTQSSLLTTRLKIEAYRKPEPNIVITGVAGRIVLTDLETNTLIDQLNEAIDFLNE